MNFLEQQLSHTQATGNDVAAHTQQRTLQDDEPTSRTFRLPSTITLDPSDYHGWARQMQAMLEYGGMWDLVKPLTDTHTPEASMQGAAHTKESPAASSSSASVGSTQSGSNPRR